MQRGKNTGGSRSNSKGKTQRPDSKDFSPKRTPKPRFKKEPTAPKMSADGLIRLNKYISNAGISSRREADNLIKAGLVQVNDKVVTEMGYKVKPGDSVRFNNEELRAEKKVYLVLNKPKGFITTMDDPKARKTVMELISNAGPERLYPVGRLDRKTTGVLLFTNDGEMATKLMHPSSGARKIYQVSLDKRLTAADFSKIKAGLTLEDGPITVDDIAYVDDKSKSNIGLTIHSGRNRIVRRIFESLDYEVTKLDRVFFAGLTKKNLERGRWRKLGEKEVNFLKMM